MREISFVKRLKFNFNGSIAKRALVFGDADNDQYNELICANLQGELAIFKDRSPDRFAYATDLGMVTACVIGDVMNSSRNQVGAINTEGMLYIFDVQDDVQSQISNPSSRTRPTRQTVRDSSLGCPEADVNNGFILTPLHRQRLPANCKELLMADLDGDGQNELIVGLTDRVLRTYKWIKIENTNRGKFVGVYKWEFADQIGSVSLNPSQVDKCVDIIVAQPGGTYAKLQYSNKTLELPQETSLVSPEVDDPSQQLPTIVTNTQPETSDDAEQDTIKTDYIGKLTPEYHQLAIAEMRNPQVSTEVLGGIRETKDGKVNHLIVVATLDGTLMLANKNEIVWLLQVDHQIFALAIIELETSDIYHPTLSQSESTCTIVPNIDHGAYDASSNLSIKNRSSIVGSRQSSKEKTCSQYFVACAWNGKTYIVDEKRNYLRFKFDEAVSAFTAGTYHFGGESHTSLVYATFNNQIILYYDVILDNIRPMYLVNEISTELPENSGLLEKLEALAKRLNYPSIYEDVHKPLNSLDVHGLNSSYPRSLNIPLVRKLLSEILYGLTDLDVLH